MERKAQDADDLYPIAVLIDELKHEDVNVRLNSMQRLGDIGAALGVSRTREELIPFVCESTDDEDEVLLVLAEKLGTLVDHVGGPRYAQHLLVPLESLCTVEELTVRDKAVESICNIVQMMDDAAVMEHFMPVLTRLGQKDWFTSRISACALFWVAYKRVSAGAQKAMRELFGALCEDDTPMVRRAAAANMGKLCQQMTLKTLVTDIMALFISLSKDDQDSVRLLAIDNCIVLSQLLPEGQKLDQVLPVALALAKDPSWRVRWSVANKFTDLCTPMGAAVAESHMAETFEALLQDAEAEVRVAAASKVASVCSILSVQVVLQKILPRVRDLAVDPTEHVRSSLASVVMGMTPKLGKEYTIAHLLPLFLQLLKDTSPEVRLNIISKLHDVNKVVGVELLSQSLFPAIVDLAEDKQWRVRLAIIEYIPTFAEQLGEGFFDEKLKRLCLDWIQDQVFSIRKAAINNLAKLTSLFGEAWAVKTVVPGVLQLRAHNSYLMRQTMLQCCKEMAPHVSLATLENMIFPAVVSLVGDSVANVRFNVGKTFMVLAPILKNDARAADKMKAQCDIMVKDSDVDVRYYAGETLRLLM